jgi:invasion protein IalB
VRSIVKTLAVISLMACIASPATAQNEQAPSNAQGFGPRKNLQPPGEGPKAETIATHGNWVVQCAAAPEGQEGVAPGTKSCGMLQNTTSEKNQKIGLSVIVSRVKRDTGAQTLMRVIAPIGVYLPTGIPIEIDGAALPSRMVFTRCAPRVCEAFGEASAESLKKFLKGNESIFYLYDRPGNGYPMKISLQGFAAALAELDKM